MITADQLVAHAIGDYILQSDWMALNKTQRSWPAAAHAITYALPFLALSHDWRALVVIVGTHFLIDRWRLIRFFIYAKNFMAPRRDWQSWADCAGTGYPNSRPAWLTVWLMIIADNVCHVLVNGWVL